MAELTQEELAEKVGCSLGEIECWERGETMDIDVRSIVKLADATNFPVVDFLQAYHKDYKSLEVEAKRAN